MKETLTGTGNNMLLLSGNNDCNKRSQPCLFPPDGQLVHFKCGLSLSVSKILSLRQKDSLLVGYVCSTASLHYLFETLLSEV